MFVRQFRFFAPEGEGAGGSTEAPAGEAAETQGAGEGAAAGAEGAAGEAPKPNGNLLADKAPGEGEGGEKPAGEGEGGEKPAGEGEGEGAGDEPIDPASYLEALNLPDHIKKDDALLNAFLAGAAKGGMDNESVQAIVDELAPQLKEQLEAPHKAWAELQNAWQAEIKADPEIGGEKLDAAVRTIRRAFHTIGMGDDLLNALAVTGAGNNPHVIKAFHRLASAVSEGGPVTGNPARETPQKNPADVLYPSHTKQAAE